MSLVAYDSSEESDRDDSVPQLRISAKQSGLFASLPAPKRSEPGTNTSVQGFPRTKKRSEPVRITVPEIKTASSDEDEDEHVKKKSRYQGGGLSSLLPQPKHLTVKEMQRPLVPHTLTKRPSAGPPKGSKPAVQGGPSSSASPSAIKAAAKSATLQLARQIAAEDEGSDEELAPENYFSLPEAASDPPAASVASYPLTPAQYTPSLPPAPSVQDTPLNFNSNDTEAGQTPAWGSVENPQGYYDEGYYQEQTPELGDREEPGASALFNDEAFRRLQGKQNRGKEEIKFLEIKGDDQLSGNQQWMMKRMTAEPEPRKSFSKKKGDQPTGQQRRKHQITYLIHQAKERELELKNSWSENRLTRRQTQAKYGF